MTYMAKNPPSLHPHLRQILGLSLDEAREIAVVLGYRVEVLLPIIETNPWGEDEETGWVLNQSPYAPDKIKVNLDHQGKVVSYDY